LKADAPLNEQTKQISITRRIWQCPPKTINWTESIIL
jgi:hypothetical protein